MATDTPSIRQQDFRCWTRKGDREGRHWPDEDQARDSDDLAEFGELPEPCWVGQCAHCDEDFGDDDEFSQLHFETRAELESIARDMEWIVKDGELYGPDCLADAEQED